MTLMIDLPEATLAALQADAGEQGRPAEQVAAERLTLLYADADDEQAAVEEAFAEMERGEGRSFSSFAEEFDARFAARYSAK